MIIDYKFALHDKVLLIDMECKGVIDSLCTDNNGNMYRVAYWFNGDRRTTWVYEYEIKMIA